MRVVIDTNIWISGLLFGGNPQKIIELAKSKQITLICSLSLLDEIIETLNYPKFQNRLNKLEITIANLLSTIYSYVQIMPIIEIESIENLREER